MVRFIGVVLVALASSPAQAQWQGNHWIWRGGGSPLMREGYARMREQQQYYAPPAYPYQYYQPRLNYYRSYDVHPAYRYRYGYPFYNPYSW